MPYALFQIDNPHIKLLGFLLNNFFYYQNRTRIIKNIYLTTEKRMRSSPMIIVKEVFKDKRDEERNKIISKIIVRIIKNSREK
jgi:hypothetical protein